MWRAMSLWPEGHTAPEGSGEEAELHKAATQSFLTRKVRAGEGRKGENKRCEKKIQALAAKFSDLMKDPRPPD